jgi:protoporphyrinogen oxidase|tara:strand:+ start:292 stop:1794 length:1503 start_codon:yes stop_codon:yes gene_type:complete
LDRRKFIKKTALGLSVPFWLTACDTDILNSNSFPISVSSLAQSGHMIKNALSLGVSKKRYTETLIVGGGLAGMAAAHTLKNKDYLLLELDDRHGGSASANNYQGVALGRGAHYDLAYPAYYGEEVLKMFEQLEIIEYQAWNDSWSFKDRQHLIPTARRQQCFQDGMTRKALMPKTEASHKLMELLRPFEGRMILPTRLTSPDLQYLDQMTFNDFLNAQNIDTDPSFRKLIDYQMLDDYGGTSQQVSALAGIHYYTCRPYQKQFVELFSAPEGNQYFVNKMHQQLSSHRILTQHLVYRIEKQGAGYLVDALDIAHNERLQIKTDALIYAGQKHSLPYIAPEIHSPFEKNVYAPWMVVNILTQQTKNNFGYWQNEYLDSDSGFLGFIDSSVQYQGSLKGLQCLTGYYCLKPEHRSQLLTVADHKDRIVNETLRYMRAMVKGPIQPEAAFIHVMGHAMSIPTPHHLFKTYPEMGNFKFAGADSGRLPLLFDAIDSGIMAATSL